MSTSPLPGVLASGLVTAAGDCAAQTAASVRAGLSRYRASSVTGRSLAPLTLALLPDESLPPLDAELAARRGPTWRQSRLLRLAAPALAEALRGLPEGSPPPPLFLAVPDPLPGRPAVVGESFLDDLFAQAGIELDPSASATFAAGRAGGLHALAAARAALEEGGSHALVGGVDSCLDLDLLDEWDRAGRVLGGGTRDGFAPGEGAGFLLLGSGAGASDAPRAGLRAPAFASEPGHRYSDEPYRGEGLAEAVRLALADGAGEPIRSVLGSLNGESFGAKEWGVALLRNAPAFAEELRFDHPAECYGDTGAAAGPLLVALAARGLQTGELAGPCLVWCTSERGQCAALVLEAPEEP